MPGGKIKVLTEEQARAIHEDRRTYKAIAIEFGISSMTVSNIKTGRTWKSLGLQPTQRGKRVKAYPRKKSVPESRESSYATMITNQVDYIEDKALESSVRLHF
jgi:transposase InsO family protein